MGLRTVKERNLVKSLQKFDKQLKDWLEKEPNQENGGASKRRNEDSADDVVAERSLSPSRGRKRALFSQTLSNTIPLECTPAPVRPSNAPTTTSYNSAEKTFDSNEATVGGTSDDTNDETLVQEQWDDDESRMAREETEITASKKLPIIELESAESDEEESQIMSKGKGAKMKDKNVELVPGEVLADTEEDDLFSDVSSITSASTSRIPRVDTSTESGEEETDDDATPKLKEKIISNAKAKGFLSSTQLPNRSVSPSSACGSDPASVKKTAGVSRSGRTRQIVESEPAAKESRKRNKKPGTAGSDNSSTNSPQPKKSAHKSKQAEKKKIVEDKEKVNFLDESEDSIDSNPPVATTKSQKTRASSSRSAAKSKSNKK